MQKPQNEMQKMGKIFHADAREREAKETEEKKTEDKETGKPQTA